jgi:hypothetical protein
MRDGIRKALALGLCELFIFLPPLGEKIRGFTEGIFLHLVLRYLFHACPLPG